MDAVGRRLVRARSPVRARRWAKCSGAPVCKGKEEREHQPKCCTFYRSTLTIGRRAIVMEWQVGRKPLFYGLAELCESRSLHVSVYIMVDSNYPTPGPGLPKNAPEPQTLCRFAERL